MTVQAGQSQVEADLPIDIPTWQVVDELVQSYAPGTDPNAVDTGPWQLGTTWGKPFDLDSTLAANGIVDGSVLLLADAQHWSRHEGQRAGPPEVPREPTTPAPVQTAQPGAWASNGPHWAAAQDQPAAAPPQEINTPAPAPPAPAPVPSQQSSAGVTEAEIATPAPAGDAEPLAGVPDPVESVSTLPLVVPVETTHALPQDRTRSHLPQPPRLPTRLRGVASAVMRPEDDSERGPAPEVPAPGRPISPLLLSLAEAPDALARARIAWREGSYRSMLETAIAGPQLRRCVTIAMLSPKGGVGKTTVTALLGTLLSMVRRDRIVAVDANPDFGSLGRILTADHHVYVDDLAEVLDDPQLTVTALDQNLGRTAHGLMVLPSPIDPARMEWLNQPIYARTIERLRQMVGVILLDCGTGLYDPANKAAVEAADQVVLVADPDPATASLVAGAAGVLSQGRTPIWLVVNKVPRRGGHLDLEAFGSYVSFARGLVTLPMEPTGVHALVKGTFDWDLAPAGLRRGVAELATDLVSAWPELGIC